MEDRYEIREQLGKGGVGAVYRAYDRHLNREVAIKRILPKGDAEDRAAAMQQMTEEAATLCSLQHPHIVTVYDVGSDEDSPFVVMELLTGRTLEELIGAGPLTWDDFRELALQTQEALIAAQERQLLHRDIKPGNVMLTWLPSGKFQVKLVDFGLAKFTPQPTQQEINKDDSIFGSIFFMAPEQFERKPLDARTDMYAMGCVYYHALSSVYPFDGSTGQAVMEAHLQHRVRPLHELRPDLPRWVADWVMWHMNRNPDDRPPDAREALEKFIIMTEQPPAATPSPGPAPEPRRRPRLIIPGVTEAEPAPDAPEAQAQPAAPPLLVRPAPPPAAVAPAPAPAPVEPVPAPRPEPRPTSPQPLQPPAGSKPSVHTAARKATTAVVAQAQAVEQPGVPVAPARPAGIGVTIGGPVLATARATQAATGQVVAAPVRKKRKKLSNAAKVAITAVLGLLVVLLAYMMLNRLGENKRTRIYNALVATAKDPDVKEIPLNREQLDILLGAASSLAAYSERETVYQCLYLGKSTDGTDIDQLVADRATEKVLADTVRIKLFKVLELRANRAVMPKLIAFARDSNKVNEVSAALQACKAMAGDDDLRDFLTVLEATDNMEVRRAAEGTIAEIVGRSQNREPIAATLASAYEKQVNRDAREALLRLLGHVGGERAAELARTALKGEDKLLRQSAILAIGNWPDDSMFPELMEYLEGEEDLQFRQRAFDTAYKFLTYHKRKRSTEESEDLWKSLAQNAKTDREQMTIINGLARIPEGDWMIPVIEYFVDEAEADRVIDQAEKALDHIRERERVRSGKGEGADEDKGEGAGGDEDKDAEAGE